MRTAARLVTLTVCFALAGCPDRNPPVDGGTDAGRDAPTIDVRADVPVTGDTGPGTDGGGEDAGMNDGGTEDGGTDDAGAPFCGDGVTNGDEDCDLSDLGLDTCVTEGFNTGALDCEDDCTFDITACRNFVCGDGLIEGTEMCDSTELGKNTCGSAGFDGGTLHCLDCALDTTDCTTCGDGTIEGTEVCDGTNLNGATCVSQGFISGSLTCGTGCGAYNTSACMSPPAPTAGQIVITEIMPNPATISDNDGEWFEVRNTSAGILQLQNCVFSDNQATPSTFTVTTSLLIPAGGYATFARSALVGFTPTYVYPTAWGLANTNDQILLTCGTAMIDQVTYTTAAVWHFPEGTATSLDASSTTAAANDSATNWCAATAQYEATGPNFGTPGAANPVCGSTSPEVCTGGLDEDGDTFIDCADTDCASAPACVTAPEICTGGIDEDGDTFIDCADSDCASAPACRTRTGALFFSEYLEGSSNNKAIEIWNDSATARDLTGCSVRIYSNGGTTASTTLNLTATVAAGDVFVICNAVASIFPTGTCDATSAVAAFNGDDALELVCGTATVDVIGQIGFRPTSPSAWTGGTPLVSTAEMTLRRRCTVTGGDANGADVFDPSIQWRGFAQDAAGDIGTGSCAP